MDFVIRHEFNAFPIRYFPNHSHSHCAPRTHLNKYCLRINHLYIYLTRFGWMIDRTLKAVRAYICNINSFEHEFCSFIVHECESHKEKNYSGRMVFETGTQFNNLKSQQKWIIFEKNHSHCMFACSSLHFVCVSKGINNLKMINVCMALA